MSPGKTNRRTIRQEPRFDEQIERLGISHKRLDAVLLAVGFGLCREPERFPKVPGTCLSVIKCAVYPEAPSVRIFFTYTEDEVHLIMIEFSEDEVLPTLSYKE